MYINKGKKFPTRKEHDLEASGTLDFGLVKTLSPNNKFYCKTKKCTYYVSLYFHKLKYV